MEYKNIEKYLGRELNEKDIHRITSKFDYWIDLFYNKDGNALIPIEGKARDLFLFIILFYIDILIETKRLPPNGAPEETRFGCILSAIPFAIQEGPGKIKELLETVIEILNPED